MAVTGHGGTRFGRLFSGSYLDLGTLKPQRAGSEIGKGNSHDSGAFVPWSWTLFPGANPTVSREAFPTLTSSS